MTYDTPCKKCGRYLGSCASNADVTEYHIMLLCGLEHKPPKGVRNNITTTE